MRPLHFLPILVLEHGNIGLLGPHSHTSIFYSIVPPSFCSPAPVSSIRHVCSFQGRWRGSAVFCFFIIFISPSSLRPPIPPHPAFFSRPLTSACLPRISDSAISSYPSVALLFFSPSPTQYPHHPPSQINLCSSRAAGCGGLGGGRVVESLRFF